MPRPKFLWHAEHIFAAHADDRTAIFGTFYNGFDGNAFSSKNGLDVERYLDACRVEFIVLYQHGFECLFLSHL